MATVVVVLPASPPGSSKPRPIEVMLASVVSGVISEMAPTNVVLPTPKPPATRTFTGTGSTRFATAGSECADTVDQPPDERDVVAGRDGRGGQVEQPVTGQVTHQHQRHPHGHAHGRRQLDHARRLGGQPQEPLVLPGGDGQTVGPG